MRSSRQSVVENRQSVVTEKIKVDHDKAQPDSNGGVSVSTKLIFGLFGLGPGWTVVNALFQQVPYFEKTQPEGVCVNAFINLAIACGILFLGFNYVYMVNFNNGKAMSHRFAVPMVMAFSIFAMFFLAIFWNYTIGGASIPAWLGAWFGGGVGGLTTIMLMPFLSLYKSDCLTAFRLGMDGGNLLAAGVAALQRPGSPNSLFSPTVYFVAFGTLIFVSVVAYWWIIKTGIGLIKADEAVDVTSPTVEMTDTTREVKEEGKEENRDDIPNPILGGDEEEGKVEAVSETSSDSSRQANKVPTPVDDTVGKAEDSNSSLAVLKSWDKALFETEKLALDAVFRSICACFPATMASRGWFRITLPYFMNIFLVALTAFGLTPSLLPLALYTATGNLVEQENLLQLAVQISAPGVMVGSFATFYVDIPLRYPVFLYLVMLFTIYCYSGLEVQVRQGYTDQARHSLGISLVGVYCLAQYVSGYILIMAWRKAAIEPPEEHREESARWCGYADQVASLVGTLVALPIIFTASSSTCGL